MMMMGLGHSQCRASLCFGGAGNEFGEKGAEHLSAALRVNKTITQINLECENHMRALSLRGWSTC